MQRHRFQHDGLTFSYLRAHRIEGATYEPLALAPAWRVLALGQRGLGYLTRAKT